MSFETSDADAGLRLDQFLARRMPESSRARVQQWIHGGRVRLDGGVAKAAARLRAGQRIDVEPEPAPPLAQAFPEAIPLEILYEDADVIAVNKPAGLTVHAGAGRRSGTLVNALLDRFGQLSSVGGPLRPGIVHRLDRLTSGVLLVAKNDRAHRGLAEQFARREVRKTYLALVHARKRPERGRQVIVDGVSWRRLEMPIGRDPHRRTRMTARARKGRPAVTDYRVIEQWRGFCLLEVRIATGRTHQIRVHLAAVGHPVAGDVLYGAAAQPTLDRPFLHAREIVVAHPATGKPLTVEAPPPAELEAHLAGLRAGRSPLALL